MKSLFIALGAVALVAFATARPFDYSAIPSGKFRGPYTIVAGNGGATGNVTVRVAVPRNGQSMRVKIKGTLTNGDEQQPIMCTLRFDKNGRVRSDAALLGFRGPLATKASRVRGKGRFLKVRLKTKPGAMLEDFEVKSNTLYRLRFSRNFLAITGKGSIPSSTPSATPQPVSFSVVAD